MNKSKRTGKMAAKFGRLIKQKLANFVHKTFTGPNAKLVHLDETEPNFIGEFLS